MLYRSLDRIAAEADVPAAPDLPSAPELSRGERLERWAELLGREPGRRLRALHGIEYGTPDERVAYRADGSPLSVAYADPVLCAAGLEGDTVGDAGEFFGLSHGQLHDLLCFCHHGGTVSAATAAAQARAFARQGGMLGRRRRPRCRGCRRPDARGHALLRRGLGPRHERHPPPGGRSPPAW